MWRDEDSDSRSKIRTELMAPEDAMDFAEAHLSENLEDIIERYKEETSNDWVY